MLPQGFLDRMKRMLGNEYDAFLETFGQERAQALRLNALKRGKDGRNALGLQQGQESRRIGAARQAPGTVSGLPPESAPGSVSESALGSAPEGNAGFLHLSKVPWAEHCYYYEAANQPGKHPYHEAGVYYIQEPSAMAPAGLLEVRPGERVLDLCAAPGGKSTQIAAKLGGEGFLLCNEIHGARARILSENVERMGIVNAYVTNETPAHLAEIFPEYFDKVLVDAPCSGEGMFRKNESACEEWSPENVAMCAVRQDEILDCAARMLRPGGRLVYSTCTFAPAENEGSVSRFLERWPEFGLLPIAKGVFGAVCCDGSGEYLREGALQPEPYAGNGVPQPGTHSENGFCQQDVDRKGSGETGGRQEGNGKHPTQYLENTLRLWPQRIKGEGHFAAVFEKHGEQSADCRNKPQNGYVTGVSEKELGEYRKFCLEMFGKGEAPFEKCQDPAYIKFGDNVYLVSRLMPSVKGLKVLRPGLHIGTLKKNRFEPAHALALALSPDEVRHVWNLEFEDNFNAKDQRVMAYLNGQTFPAEGDKGWYLICVDGFGIGWGKLAGGMMKNHYPKGLRIQGMETKGDGLFAGKQKES